MPPAVLLSTASARAATAAHAAHARARTSHNYERRRPEQTVLCQVVEQHWPGFRERAERASGLPRFVVREMEEFLRCGRLEFGSLWLACQECGFERLVAWSCKRRGFCPSCLGRRMNDLAVHLVERVIPEVPVRQWVCSLPFRLCYLCGYEISCPWRARDVAVTSWGPVGGGALTGQYEKGKPYPKGDWLAEGPWGASILTERNPGIGEVVKRIASEIDKTPSQVAIAWVLAQRKRANIVPIIGARG